MSVNLVINVEEEKKKPISYSNKYFKGLPLQ